MKKVKKLQSILKEIESQLAKCTHCGLCQSVCPVYGQTLHEGDVARGKLVLLDGLGRELITDSGSVRKKLEKCLLCGSCMATCPAGVRSMEIFLKARAALTEYEGLSFAEKLLFRIGLSRPGFFNQVTGLGARFQKYMIHEANAYYGTSCAPMLEAVLGNRHIVPLAKTPLHKEIPFLDTKAGASGLSIAFFPGCLVDKVYPGVGKAALKIFKHHEIGVLMPKNQPCCGMPSLASGDTSSFEKLVNLNLDLFSGKKFDYFVTPCATCTATFKKIWPMMAESLGLARKNEVLAFSENVMDIQEFLVKHLGLEENVQDKGTSVTIHDPCHLFKSLGVYSAQRVLVSQGEKYGILEMKESTSCCGAGGSFTLKHYETSSAIGKKKRDRILASSASMVATGCPACMMQLTDVLSKAGDRIQVRHTIELYAESLDESPQKTRERKGKANAI